MSKMKNGFVFAETLIVVSILAVSLMVVYRSFSTSITNEKRRLNQNNIVYLYRTYYILDYLQNNGLDSYISYFNQPSTITSGIVSQSITCNFRINNNTRLFCETLIKYDASSGNGIKVYLLKSNIKDLFDNAHKWELNSFSPGAISYLKTLSNLGLNEYLLFIEFVENCRTVEKVKMCDYNYASLKVGA